MIAWIESFVLNYWTAFGLICVLLYFYIQNSLKYWQKRGVPLIESQSPLEIIFNIISGKKSLSEVYEDVYNRLEGHRFGGVYLMLTPIFVLRDPEIIKCIMLKDFESFHERGMYVDEKKDPLTANKMEEVSGEIIAWFHAEKHAPLFQNYVGNDGRSRLTF